MWRDTVAIKIKNSLNSAEFSGRKIRNVNKLQGRCEAVLNAAQALSNQFSS